MNGWKTWKTWTASIAIVGLSLAGVMVGTEANAVASAHPATGVGSCTLKGWNPSTDPGDATNLPEGQRPQTYRPDDYNCNGAVFSAPGTEFTKYPQSRDFTITNKKTTEQVRTCSGTFCSTRPEAVSRPTQATNPTAPYFPPFTHFVIIVRENHTFDDYLGDCATTIQAGCNGKVQSTNHISQVPYLHQLAKNYSLMDSYSTGTQPPSGPNHWWLFSGQSQSSSQQQSYPSATGTQFDRFLNNGGTQVPFITNGDIYWMVNNGSGYWRNPSTGSVEALPVNRPGTTIPEELHYNEYSCCGQNISDTTIANDYLSWVGTNGLATYNYVELFNDHPGTYQDIATNDSTTNQIVSSIMGNAAYKDNTMIAITEDDTQNGNNGPDHVSNTYRVPTVVVASPTYMKQHYITHVAYSTNNVLAAMERVMNNVHPGIIDPNDNLGLSTFPMTTNDQSALGDPLEDLWIQGATPLTASASASPTTGNAPLGVNFTGSASGGTAPYSYSWNFGDGTTSTAQNPSHTYNSAGTYTATVTVTDSASPAVTATANTTVTVSAVGQPLTATASAIPTSGQIPVNVSFTGTATGGSPAYSYSWNFGDGTTSTTQNPSHTYNTAGTYNVSLTVTDSSAPAKTASSSVTISADPVQGTAPGAPTALAATGGSSQVSLNWQAPANSGGVNITSYRVYRSTSSGTETLLTGGGCGNLGSVLSCTDTGLASGQTYYYKVSAVNAIGEGAQSNEASAAPTASTCTAAQLIGNPGFENGTNSAPWSTGSGVIYNGSSEPPHSGSWDAWLDGYGTTHTDTLSQSLTLPNGCANYNLSFWLHVDTAETSKTTVYDTLTVQVLNSSGTVLATLHTYSNLDHITGYAQHSFSLAPYAGQHITLKFTGTEDFEYQTSFVIDDTALNVS